MNNLYIFNSLRLKLRTYILQDLENALSESRAKWKIVVGHHAIRSVGHHGDTNELVERLLPILRVINLFKFDNFLHYKI